MRLTNQLGEGFAASEGDVAAAIDALDADSNPFTVLGIDEERYIQTAFESGGLVVEKRGGGAASHVIARRLGGDGHFSRDEVKRLFLAYFRRAPFDPIISWQPLALDSVAGLSGLRQIAWGKVAVLVGIVAALVAVTALVRDWLA